MKSIASFKVQLQNLATVTDLLKKNKNKIKNTKDLSSTNVLQFHEKLLDELERQIQILNNFTGYRFTNDETETAKFLSNSSEFKGFVNKINDKIGAPGVR